MLLDSSPVLVVEVLFLVLLTPVVLVALCSFYTLGVFHVEDDLTSNEIIESTSVGELKRVLYCPNQSDQLLYTSLGSYHTLQLKGKSLCCST